MADTHYETLAQQLAEAPLTWLPALLVVAVETCIRRGVFREGKLLDTVARVIAKETDRG